MGSKNYGVTTLKVTSGYVTKITLELRQEVTSALRYKNHFRITSGSYIRLALRNDVTKPCK